MMEEQTKPRVPRVFMAWFMAFCMIVGCMMPSFAWAADGTGSATLGSKNTKFEAGTTYIVPISLKNAGDPTHANPSAAAACPGKYGKLTVAADGTATLQFETRGVTVGTLTDYAYDFKVYQGDLYDGNTMKATKPATVDATVDANYTDIKSSQAKKDVPHYITITIPSAMKALDGVYLSMFVDAMGYAPDAWLQVDYDKAVESGDASLNYTKTSTVHIDPFGEYDIDVTTTVTDGVVSDVQIEGANWQGNNIEDNKQYLDRAVNGTAMVIQGKRYEATEGMKEKLIGLYDTDSSVMNDLDTISMATTSAAAIKEATMKSLGIEIPKEVIPDAPEAVPDPGYYTIGFTDVTNVVHHSLTGNDKNKWGWYTPVTGYLYVDDNKKMWLTYNVLNDTEKEPLHVLKFNGYYPNNDSDQDYTDDSTTKELSKKLSMDGVSYKTTVVDIPNMGENEVVTQVTMPLDSVRQTYLTSVYLYVNAMRKLGDPTVLVDPSDESKGYKSCPESASGVWFDHGKFNIDSTITLYWDTLNKVESQSISGKSTFSKTYGDKAFSLGAKAEGALSYKSGNTKVATVSKDGKVTIKGAGTAKITVSAAATDGYAAASKTVTVKVAKAAQPLKAKAGTKTVKAKSLKKKAKTVKALKVTGAKGKLSYKKASGSNKLTVNAKTGKVTVKKGAKKGTYTAKVKVSAKATANYKAASKTVAVKVKVK